MTDYQKGEYVLAISSGSGDLVRGYGRTSYEKDAELVITSKTSSYLNVRPAAGGSVFRITRSDVFRPTRALGEVPEGAIPADDPRVSWLFEDAARLANRLGLCSDFDRIADALGVPGRERMFTIKLAVSEGVDITAKVTARSKKLAEQRIRDQFALAAVPTIRAIAVAS
jgi:hypothetical protein